MHYTLDTVQVAVELTLKYRLKVGLHVPSGNFYDVADAVLCSYLELVKVRSDYFNLVILYLGSLLGLYQLEAVYAGAVKLNLHIAPADNLALKCGCKCNGNINIRYLDLHISCLNGGRIEFLGIALEN